MLIDVLILRPDGTQQLEHREVSDDYYKHGDENAVKENKAQ